jgi:hypothetical protein
MATDTSVMLEYRQQAQIFLAKARAYLAEGDLHQASEKAGGQRPTWSRLLQKP